MRQSRTPSRFVGLIVVAATVVVALSGCGKGVAGGGGDANYRMACPPPLGFDDRPYREMPTTTQDLPLGRDLGSAETLGCGDESGEKVPVEKVTVHEVIGIPTTSAVAAIVGGKLHLYVSDDVPPGERCQLQFVKCPTESASP